MFAGSLVACTNWKRLWMVLTGLKKENDHVMKMPKTLVHRHHEMMMLIKQPHSTRVLVKKLNTYTKLLVVRDPYQRLLSAYRDKFEDKGEEFYIKNYAPVIRTFRQNVSDSRSPKPDTGVTFSEFVSYILSLPKTSFDEHWRPYQQLCFPCDIHYDVIGKYETLVKDSEHFLRLIGAPETLHFPAYAPSRTSELLQAYMASLSHHQRQGLRKVYEMDFEMFQYRDKL
nr:carbohydrate sulfotransferase 11-like [Procambarus clarkii]